MKYSKQQIKAIKAKSAGFTRKDYFKNEAINNHTENVVALIEKFGTPKEIEEIHGIAERHDQSGISMQDYNRRYKISNKYFKKLGNGN